MSNVAYRVQNKLRRALIKDYHELSYNLTRFQKSRIRQKRVSRPEDFEKKIEILIPCYNHAQYLQAAFQSIERQTWNNHPITVTFINDNSTDDTVDMIKALIRTSKKRSNIVCRLIQNDTNLRQDGSINKAVHESSSELFIILNDDDALTPDAVEMIVKTLSEHKELYMVGGSSIWFDTAEPPKYVRQKVAKKLTIHAPRNSDKIRTLNDINMTHSSSAFFKSAWEMAGGYRSKNKRLTQDINEDRDFQLRVSSLVPIGVYATYPLAFWRTDSSHGKGY